MSNISIKISFPLNDLLGDILPVLGALPLWFLLGVHVLSGLSIRPVLWLVPVFIPLPAAEQCRPVSWGYEGRQGSRSAPSAAGTSALPLVWRVQRLRCLYSGISRIIIVKVLQLDSVPLYSWFIQNYLLLTGPLLRVADKFQQERWLPV